MSGKFLKLRLIYIFSDWIATSLAFLCFNIFRYSYFDVTKINTSTVWGFLGETKIILEQILIPIGCLGIYWLSGFYNIPYPKSRLQEFITTFFSSLLATLIIFFLLLTNDMGLLRSSNYLVLLMLWAPLFILPLTGRAIITGLTIKTLRRQGWSLSVVIVGASKEALKAASQIADPRSNINQKVVAFLPIENENIAVPAAQTIDLPTLKEMCAKKRVDRLLIVPETKDDEKVLHLLDTFFPLGVSVKIYPDTFSFVTAGIRLQDIYAEPLLDLSSPNISESSKNVKRLIDVVASAVALMIFALPFAVIAWKVKRSSPGPVFYLQERIGLRQRPFKIIKFRSMRTDAEEMGPRLSSPDDDRITPFGAFMRKYRIDELPQFWNVLRGDMSLVGPRPEREYYIRKIRQSAPWYTLIHQVRPGITSWGMVKYGYAVSVEEMVKRARFDLVYLSNMSNSVDIKILIYTVRTVLKGKGM